jgi:hypothetical protein
MGSPMICTQCHDEGRRSKVYDEGSTMTLLAAQTFYDEDGNKHFHDPNGQTTHYRCSNGHRWQEAAVKKSCWCGWGKS